MHHQMSNSADFAPNPHPSDRACLLWVDDKVVVVVVVLVGVAVYVFLRVAGATGIYMGRGSYFLE